MYVNKLFYGVNSVSILFIHCHDHDFLLVKPLINSSPQWLISPTLPPMVSLYLFSSQDFDASRAMSWTL